MSSYTLLKEARGFEGLKTGLKWAIQGKDMLSPGSDWGNEDLFDSFDEAKEVWDDVFSGLNTSGDYMYRLVTVKFDTYGNYEGVEEELERNSGYGNIYDEDLKEDNQEISAEDIEEIQDQDVIKAEPEEFINRGISGMLSDLIIDEWDAINAYNGAIATLTEMDPESPIINILNDIVNEEMIHVGQLQTALESISANAENIQLGKEEADNQLEEKN